MRKSILLLWTVLGLFQIIKGQTSTKVVEDFHQEKIAFFSDWWQNPAMRFYFSLQQFTDISLSLSEQENEAFAVQQGTGNHRFYFRANSFFRDTTKLYYGKATYTKWNKEGYKWSTVADIDLLQPYILADTIVGKMYSERYFFSGGYAKRFARLGIGALASYRTTTAYKKKDPRPNSTVSDLELNVGLSWAMSSKYTLGFHCNFNKYKQDQNVKIYKNGGGAAFFYLRGLGVADKRFSTVITDKSPVANKYKKTVWETTLSLFPVRQTGVLGMLAYSQYNLKLLKYNGSILLDISNLHTQMAKATIGYKFNLGEMGLLLKAYGQYQQQKGKEYIYKRNMKLLFTPEKYKKSDYMVGVQALANYGKGKHNSLTMIDIVYHNLEEQYAGSQANTSNTENWGNVTGVLQENLLWDFEKSSLLTKFFVSYRHNLNKELNTGTLTVKRAKETLVVPDYLFATANCISGQFAIRYDYQLTAKYRVYARGALNYANYQDIGDRKEYKISVGMAF